MKITLSADEKLIEKAREYAQRHQTSLNNLIREDLKKITNESSGSTPGDDFARLSAEYAGESEPGYHFNRDELYDREKSND